MKYAKYIIGVLLILFMCIIVAFMDDWAPHTGPTLLAGVIPAGAALILLFGASLPTFDA